MFAPTGLASCMQRNIPDAMPPYQGGGSMIQNVDFDNITYGNLPNKFEAGTPNIAGSIGLGAAIDYLNSIDFDGAAKYEANLLEYAHDVLRGVPDLKLLGTAECKVGVLSFILSDIHPHDFGHHSRPGRCRGSRRTPLRATVMKHYDIPAATRAFPIIFTTRVRQLTRWSLAFAACERFLADSDCANLSANHSGSQQKPQEIFAYSIQQTALPKGYNPTVRR